jgi:transcriptional regulatory protein LevR
VARRVTPKEPSEHLTVLSRMVRQVEIDEHLAKLRKKKLIKKLSEVMSEFQKELGAQ